MKEFWTYNLKGSNFIQPASHMKKFFLYVLILLAIYALILGVSNGIFMSTSFLLGLSISYFLFNFPFGSNITTKRRRTLRLYHVQGDQDNPSISPYEWRKSCQKGRSSLTAAADEISPAVAFAAQLVPTDLDAALNQFLEKIMDEYVLKWYSNISPDATFQYELRADIRKIICTLYQRCTQVQLNDLISERILPLCVNFFQMRRRRSEDGTDHLHVAVHSRRSELLYLRVLSQHLLEHLLPKSSHLCKSYKILFREILSKSILLSFSDAICDPAVVNLLVSYCLTAAAADGRVATTTSAAMEKRRCDSSSSLLETRKVELLQRFVSAYCKKSLPAGSLFTSLHPQIKVVLSNTALLNGFMSYLKNRNVDHMLQFYLDVECFNRKISNSHLNADELDDLFRDAWDLYSVYFSSRSPYCIPFQKDLASLLRKALSKDVLKLKTTTVLFEAFHQVTSMLSSYSDDFSASVEFHAYLYGRSSVLDVVIKNDSTATASMVVTTASPTTTNTTTVNTSTDAGDNVKKKLNKLTEEVKWDCISEEKNCFTVSSSTTNTITTLTNPTTITTATVTMYTSVSEASVLEFGEDVQQQQPTSSLNERNLSKWSIFIPTVTSRVDTTVNNSKTYIVLIIHVQSGDDYKEWLIERRPSDLHYLDSKLTEFHGQFMDIELPSRRLTTITLEHVQIYEDYLNKLLRNVNLRTSELLYAFLTANHNYGDEENAFSRQLRKSVTTSLRKERGQGLEMFIKLFINNCSVVQKYEYEWKEAESPKEERTTTTATGTYSRESTNFQQQSTVYENNYNIDPAVISEEFFHNLRAREAPEHIVNADTGNNFARTLLLSIYIILQQYKIPAQCIKVVIIIVGLFLVKCTEIVSELIIRYVNYISHRGKIATHLINAIDWVVFHKRDSRNTEAKEMLKELVKVSVTNSLLQPLYHLFFNRLQDPKMNKQLYYHLLDTTVVELFPELLSTGGTRKEK